MVHGFWEVLCQSVIRDKDRRTRQTAVDYSHFPVVFDHSAMLVVLLLPFPCTLALVFWSGGLGNRPTWISTSNTIKSKTYKTNVHMYDHTDWHCNHMVKMPLTFRQAAVGTPNLPTPHLICNVISTTMHLAHSQSILEDLWPVYTHSICTCGTGCMYEMC